MTTQDRPRARFSVDTHLFRELGELLVGRESTALIELVKNAYDADATEVTVFGENIGDPNRGIIRITDNGVGMNPETFRRGFLRVAARIKNEGDRKSLRWSRRFTGAKGVGRLAAHKLARRIEIQSTPWTGGESSVGVDGFIDWDKVEQAETLDQIPEDAVFLAEKRVKKSGAHGTILTLTRLRQKWTQGQRGRFLLEVEALRAPPLITDSIPRTIVPKGGLFDRPFVVDAKKTDPGFTLTLEGDFEAGEGYWPAVLAAAGWLLEIDASPERIRYAVAPTKKGLMDFPAARPVEFSEPHPAPERGPFFQARIFVREGPTTGNRNEKSWASRVAGVRVYMEGFRVLPYGEEADDWLALARDTANRDRKLRFLAESVASDKLAEIDDEGLLLLPSKHYFGGVFLTVNRAGSLEMLINREGFVPDGAFETLVTLVRRGVDLSTRVRAAARASKRAASPETAVPERRGDAGSDPSPQLRGSLPREEPLRRKAEGSLRRLAELGSELERLAKHAPEPLRVKLLSAATDLNEATALSREVIPASSLVLVLASVGTQLAAFTHEINHLLTLASDLETVITRLQSLELPARVRNQTSKVVAAASELRRAIERQAAYLVDIVTPDARRRRSRLKVSEILNATWKLVATAAEQRGITLRNAIKDDVRTPPMFRAELMAVFTNLLTNAVKAAGKDGVIAASATTTDDRALRIRLENTGAAVNPNDGERWFRPFESTTVDVDPVLGQGMGLGLGITRDLLAEVGGQIVFVQPHRGFSTALEIEFPGVDS